MISSIAVIRTYLAMTGLYALAASLIWGVNTLFLLDAGLSLMGVFVANAVFTGSMVVFEVPTGVIADTRGRRDSFVLSIALLLIGTLGYLSVSKVGGGLVAFCGWSVFLGLGYTFYSGAMEAWLVDALEYTEYEGSIDRVLAQSQMVWGVAMLVGTVGGGFLAGIDLSMPYIARAGLLVVLFVVAAREMRDLGFNPRRMTVEEMPAEMHRVASAGIERGWNQPNVRLVLLSGAIVSISSAWGFHAWQPYFLELLGSDKVWVAGVIAAGAAVSAMLGNLLVTVLSRFLGRRTDLLIFGYAVQVIAFGAVGLVPNFAVAVTCYLVAMAASGIVTPVRGAFIHAKTSSEHRATVLSFDSLVSSGASTVGQTGLGGVATRFGFGPGYLIGGALGLLVLPLMLKLRSSKDPADKFETSAGKRVCCPVGLPEAAAAE